jgi:hypothetical protein
MRVVALLMTKAATMKKVLPEKSQKSAAGHLR